MSEIIDKVAKAIENEDLRIQAEGGGKGLAVAALEALADGLVWNCFQSPGLTQYTLSFGELSLGSVQQWLELEEKWQIHFNGEFEKVATKQEAKSALMNKARRVLFGLGPMQE